MPVDFPPLSQNISRWWKLVTTTFVSYVFLWGRKLIAAVCCWNQDDPGWFLVGCHSISAWSSPFFNLCITLLGPFCLFPTQWGVLSNYARIPLTMSVVAGPVICVCMCERSIPVDYSSHSNAANTIGALMLKSINHTGPTLKAWRVSIMCFKMQPWDKTQEKPYHLFIPLFIWVGYICEKLCKLLAQWRFSKWENQTWQMDYSCSFIFMQKYKMSLYSYLDETYPSKG